MNKEEIEKAKQCLNEIIQNSYAERKAIKLDNLRKYIQELEQKQFILDKVTKTLKRDREIFDKCRKIHEMYSPSEERMNTKYYYTEKLLNIIEGENRK